MKIAILGAGNMGSAIACGLVRSGKFQAEEIVCTARTEATLERLRTQCPGVRTTTDNAAAVRDAAVVMLAVKPWLTEALIREIRREIDPDRQSVVSVAAGVSLAQLAEWMTADSAVRPALFRVIPNTAIAVRQSMTFVAARGADEACTERVLGIFRELGEAMLVDEPMLETGMILASCGIAFALRYVRASGRRRSGTGLSGRAATHIVGRDAPRCGRTAVAAGRTSRNRDRPRDHAGRDHRPRSERNGAGRIFGSRDPRVEGLQIGGG